MRSSCQTTSISKYLIVALLLLALPGTNAWSQEQDTTTIVRIETKDGNEYVGRIVESGTNGSEFK